MRTETINKQNFAVTKWDDNYFKYCDFEDFSMEGAVISSDFVGCSFKNIDWYWGLFSGANFIDCQFIDCVFRGSTFADSKFVECKLINCHFLKDNLDADCDFSTTTAYRCSLDGGVGFKVEIVT